MHTRSFKTALRAALREDPDVVLIGEMRDLETVSIALETAETGHLVFATLHTTTAATTIDRIIDQYPSDQQEQIRVMLADSLRGIISQTLVKRIGGGRVAAREVLFNTAPVANLIRERKTFQIASIMQTSKRLGMLTMNDALLELVDVEPGRNRGCVHTRHRQGEFCRRVESQRLRHRRAGARIPTPQWIGAPVRSVLGDCGVARASWASSS